jgi:hypothetical protein
MQQRELFAEEALKESFPRLVSFVTEVYSIACTTNATLLLHLPLSLPANISAICDL